MKIGLLILVSSCSAALADDFTKQCADRAAIERVYYAHRLGTKPPFEETLPRAAVENLVRQDLKKESALRTHYHVTITSTLLDAEVQRITTTTRAPEMLAEIKTALGNNPARFANAFARPLLVERLLRDKFENDDALHASQRRECERIRTDLLASQTNGATTSELLVQLKVAHSNAVSETTWQLTPRPASTNGPSADEWEVKKRFGPDAQLLSAPYAAGKDRQLYFEDMPLELQRVLAVQLRAPADVSAVIETPGGFLLYVAKEKTEITLRVAGLSLPKRSYEQWLEEQHGGDK